MAPPRFLPSDSVLKKWLDEGLTHKQIQARIKEQDGVEVALGTISAAISRAGLSNPVRYPTIPWHPIRADHQNAYPLLMLRYLGRRELGEEMTAEQNRRLDAWIERLEKENACVAYRPDSEQGWYYVRRRPGDGITRPD